ncbi:MAG: hypothetical protein ACXIU7_07855 [Roseinatronobacter sp.]
MTDLVTRPARTGLETGPDDALGAPMRKSAQHLRWLVRAFDQQTRDLSARTGIRYTTNPRKLAQAALEWRRDFDAQKPSQSADYPAYVGFAAGLMLRKLLQHKPTVIDTLPDDADPEHPAIFWPDGYLYVCFCLNVRGLILESDFGNRQTPRPELDELRTWWSFRENVAQDPGLALAFLDYFAGAEPNWQNPGLFHPGLGPALTAQYFTERLDKPDD